MHFSADKAHWFNGHSISHDALIDNRLQKWVIKRSDFRVKCIPIQFNNLSEYLFRKFLERLYWGGGVDIHILEIEIKKRSLPRINQKFF